MSKAQDEIAELMALQREAQAPKPRREKARKKRRSATTEDSTPADEAEVASDTAAAADSEAADEEEMSDLQKSMKEFSDNLETAVQEIEESAKDQPLLTAVVAFTLGLVVGQLFTRR